MMAEHERFFYLQLWFMSSLNGVSDSQKGLIL